MKKLIVLIGWLALTGSAYAGSMTIDFVGFQQDNWQLGYPYSARINGGSAIGVMCDDWEHGGAPGDMWQANFTNLGTGNLSLLRFNQLPAALTLYHEAGWLLLQTEVAPQSQWQSINYAVWNILDSSVPPFGSSPTWVALAQQEANRGFPGIDFYQVGIYTPVDQHDPNLDNPQELLRIVPEPGSLILACAGVMALVAKRRLS